MCNYEVEKKLCNELLVEPLLPQMAVFHFKDKNNMQTITDTFINEGYTVQCCKRDKGWDVGVLFKSWKDE